MGMVILIMWTIVSSTSPNGKATERTWASQPDMETCRLNAKSVIDATHGALCINIIGKNNPEQPL